MEKNGMIVGVWLKVVVSLFGVS